MLTTLRNALKVKEIRKKIFFTLFVLLIYRLGTQITVPGVNAAALTEGTSGLVALLDTVSGGGLSNYSLFSMGVSPFITAQIVIQLLQMDIVPKFVEWSKQGEVGRRKLNQATRWLTIVLAFVQSIGITAGLNYLSGNALVKNLSPQTFIVLGIILTGGTMLLTWLGDQITDKGVGNGVSMIIFAGIIARLPQGIYELVNDNIINNIGTSDLTMGIVFLAVLVIAILFIVYWVTFVQQANRKVPIQYTRRAAGGGSESYLPLKVNVSGVIPVIFASSFIVTPSTILMLFQQNHSEDGWFQTLSNIFSMQTTAGSLIYTVLIVLFTFFYAFVQVNPEKLAENLQKQGAYIPSVWPGKETEKYFSGLLMRLSTVGAIFLGAVALLPQLAANLWGLPQSIGLGGTSLLIVVGVALETSRQLDGLMMKRQYVGFIR
ncbi:secY protein [Lapidilactobacillus concavus DSM 17758]|jgi:preprotein translocase subunit SecY|uniref:Protein translocase subunit SecY n=1 Tax=Lapidilactobacillus concavus DSM 17758 TaxID=1423735 RepID=A0A0R1W4Z6_9LACO|nr:preprotein translocase subunit SecY [Lapidilactobacillus concavus]KRM12727.1 secY protein [Lapidilactobacillus concavus DSM 17758]GEL13254.1 protein translocase subunit SecY [Lapidilactobacillus concavus]